MLQYTSNVSEVLNKIIAEMKEKIEPLVSPDKANEILSKYRCPIHNHTPVATKKGETMKIDFCCQESWDEGQRLLNVNE